MLLEADEQFPVASWVICDEPRITVNTRGSLQHRFVRLSFSAKALGRRVRVTNDGYAPTTPPTLHDARMALRFARECDATPACLNHLSWLASRLAAEQVLAMHNDLQRVAQLVYCALDPHPGLQHFASQRCMPLVRGGCMRCVQSESEQVRLLHWCQPAQARRCGSHHQRSSDAVRPSRRLACAQDAAEHCTHAAQAWSLGALSGLRCCSNAADTLCAESAVLGGYGVPQAEASCSCGLVSTAGMVYLMCMH